MCFQISLFSSRYCALKAGVVVSTIFSCLLRVAETITGAVTPLFAKALLMLLRRVSELIGDVDL